MAVVRIHADDLGRSISGFPPFLGAVANALSCILFACTGVGVRADTVESSPDDGRLGHNHGGACHRNASLFQPEFLRFTAYESIRKSANSRRSTGQPSLERGDGDLF